MGRNVLPGMVLALVVGFAARSGVAGADDARAVIKKAIKAQGGEEKLAQVKAGRWKGQGTLTLKGQEFPLTLETVYQLPDKYKTAMHFAVQGKKIRVIQVLVGDKAWMSGEGKTLNLKGDLLKVFKEEFYSANVELLVPLLKEKGYTLSRLKDTKVNGKPAVGVKVAAKDHKDIELYFDRDSFLPVKTVRPTIDAETMKEATVEVIYSDIKEVDGIKYPTKIVANQNGKKLMELEVTEFKKLDKLDPNEFAKPK
jgi:hypothetical protein